MVWKIIAVYFLFLISGCGDLGPSNSNPSYFKYSKSKDILIDAVGGSVAEPFVIFDNENNAWRMFFFRLGGDGVTCNTRTSDALTGPWGDEHRLRELDEFSKMAILVDEKGAPVRLKSMYYGYIVHSGREVNNLAVDREIYFTTSGNLGGPWSTPEKVLGVGNHKEPDSEGVDAPFAMYYHGKVFLWYMAYTNIPDKIYGLGHRLMLSESSDPAGPFQKDGIILNPSENDSEWDYGWIGGAQIGVDSDGEFWMAYNASDTRPSGPGEEPPSSAWGFAKSQSPFGPWKKNGTQPAGQAEQGNVNIWRPHLVFDPEKRVWIVFYNTGEYARESITYSDAIE